MAFSQSVKRGQAPATCNFCEEDTKIKWKCINCDVLMCAKCKDKIHAKLKNSKDHNVIDIKEVGIYQGELDFSVLKCEEHTGQSAVMFCTSCDRLVCTSCISKIHNGHGLVEISEGYNLKLEKLKTEKTEAQKQLEELTKEKEKVSPVDIKDNEQYKDLIRKIEAQNIEIKTSADKYSEELKGELKRKWNEFQVGKATKKLEKVEDNLNKLILNVEALIKSKEADKVFIECKKLSTAVSIDDIDPGTISFLPGQISTYNVGSLQVVSNAVNVRIVKQFQTDIPRVVFLSLCPDNSLWTSDNDVLQKVKPVEHKLTVEFTFNIQNVYGMSVTPTGDVLLAVGVPVLKQISGRTGELTDSIYSVKPTNPSAVYVTKDGKVIVGGCGGESTFPASGRRPVFVMNKNGNHETIYEFDKNNIRIFTYVKRITSTDNGNICVVDELSEDARGRVVVLNDGDILHIYNGHHKGINEDKPFKPVGIVTTPSDNIIVVDFVSYVFHILNNCGHLITHYNIEDIGIAMPYSLCFTRTAGQLYIGCTRGKGSLEKAKFYEVHISGC